MYRKLLFIGIVLMILGNITGVGYGLYLWGGVGLAFSASLWSAFKVWILIELVGATSFVSAVYLGDKQLQKL